MSSFPAGRRRTVALCIPSLAVGGAERQLLQLAANLDRSRWRVVLLTFDRETPSGLGDVKHIPIMGRGPLRILQLRNALFAEEADILQAYLVGSQIYGILVKVLSPAIKLVAAVRSSVGVRDIRGWKGKISHAAVFAAHRVMECYVFNSSEAERSLGRKISKKKRTVVFNGIDTHRFRPDVDATGRLRATLALPTGARIVGIVANVSAYKGYETMVHAAASVVRQAPNVHFVVVGEHRNRLGTDIQLLVKELGLVGRWHFMGSRSDVENIVAGFDFLCCSSWTEGFPNAIGEAMASGVPCVTTNVGDCAFIVADTGWVVPARDSGALAKALLEAMALDGRAVEVLRKAARGRIVENFSLMRMVDSYDHLWTSILDGEKDRDD